MAKNNFKIPSSNFITKFVLWALLIFYSIIIVVYYSSALREGAEVMDIKGNTHAKSKDNYLTNISKYFDTSKVSGNVRAK